MTDPADMPAVDCRRGPLGRRSGTGQVADGTRHQSSSVSTGGNAERPTRQVILVSNAPNGNGDAEAWRDLAARIDEGSTAVFLTLDVFQKADNPLGWLPLAEKGSMGMVSEYTFPQVYLKDEWAKRHPFFDGLPCGGLMDYTFYREIIPDWRYWGQDLPEEAVAGAFRNSAVGECHSELMLSVHRLGAGRFILNSLRVRQELGRDPTAERLLRNMLRYAARDRIGKRGQTEKGDIIDCGKPDDQ